MMRWGRRHTIIAGLAIVAGTNAIVLAGVGYNRSGEPEATLRLSERELGLPYQGAFAREKSGITLRLQWRLPPPVMTGRDAPPLYYYGAMRGEAAWLDAAKLAQLGFEVAKAGGDADAVRLQRRAREKTVFLVLELEGPAYQAALQAAQKRADERKAQADESPGSAERRRGAEDAARWLERERRSGSRLFAVDAGLDAAALRAKYPDRSRYAVVEGRVRPVYDRRSSGEVRAAGYVSALSIEGVNVPFEFREVFASLAPQYAVGDKVAAPRFEATVLYGKRLEPRLNAASRVAPARN